MSGTKHDNFTVSPDAESQRFICSLRKEISEQNTKLSIQEWREKERQAGERMLKRFNEAIRNKEVVETP